MIKLTLAKIGTHPTIVYALEELMRAFRQMDTTLMLEARTYDAYDETISGVVWLGFDGSLPLSAQDEIRIAVNRGTGVITGSNERSVLIAVYRFLHALGCRYLFPGQAGEQIPVRTMDERALTVHLHEKASYRHRGMCIEGAVSYDHVRAMIEWLPKVGMNGYFMQFKIPSDFFKRFYNSDANPYLSLEPVTDEDVTHIWMQLEEEIVKRSLDYHAVGHGWTCEPFGVTGTGWDRFEEEIPDTIHPYLAKIQGERSFWGGVPLDTNLCYSNPIVQQTMTDAIVAYCKAHPSVNFLHFWLADGKNNHCECENCVTLRPSDAYVMMLNLLDRKLTAAGIRTKIVCLIYVDLLWEPEHEKIQNPDRFVLMFAPITRTYSHTFTDFDPKNPIKLTSYVRNQLNMPSSVEENVARLAKWQNKQLRGDSFDFDYHLMWDHYIDPGYMECARILHADMANLDKIGLNGMVSCQTQRAAFPTGLPMYAMARALWDKTSTYEQICEEYFTAAYGAEGQAVQQYLSLLSTLFDPVYLRAEKPRDKEGMRQKCIEAKRQIAIFCREHSLKKQDPNIPRRYLAYHAEICTLYADVLIAYLCGGDEEEKSAAKAALMACVYAAEPEIHSVFDVNNYHDSIFHRYLRRHL